LTNKHVTHSANDPQIPKTLQDFGLPTLTLRTTSYLACFGTGAGDRVAAKLLNQSDQFDLAVLKSDRVFAAPLRFASSSPRMGDEVFAAGFPGVVQSMFDQRYFTRPRIREVVQKLVDTGHVDLVAETFSPESF